MVPVCSPGFFASVVKRPRNPADLLDLSLLHDAERQDWVLWFQAQAVGEPSQAVSCCISFYDAADPCRRIGSWAWLVCPRLTPDQPKIVASREWLIEQGRQIKPRTRRRHSR
jgi:hypothetical protein